MTKHGKLPVYYQMYLEALDDTHRVPDSLSIVLRLLIYCTYTDCDKLTVYLQKTRELFTDENRLLHCTSKL